VTTIEIPGTAVLTCYTVGIATARHFKRVVSCAAEILHHHLLAHVLATLLRAFSGTLVTAHQSPLALVGTNKLGHVFGTKATDLVVSATEVLFNSNCTFECSAVIAALVRTWVSTLKNTFTKSFTEYFTRLFRTLHFLYMTAREFSSDNCVTNPTLQVIPLAGTRCELFVSTWEFDCYLLLAAMLLGLYMTRKSYLVTAWQRLWYLHRARNTG